jgi:L-fuconolactonase
MIFMQCECEFSQCEAEVDWVTRLADIDERIKGIVAWAPLEKGLVVKEVLDRYSENKLVKGIRRIIQFESNPEFCLQKEFVQGVQLLAEYNYTFDICVSHGQLEKVIKLVRLCPDVRFVLDHIGKPDIKNQLLDPWRSQLLELSNYDNVCCKLSGLVTEANHTEWKKEDLVSYFSYVLEYFTPDRLLFGGDWPVVLQAANYTEWLETLDWLLSALALNDLLKIYRENAERVYRII